MVELTDHSLRFQAKELLEASLKALNRICFENKEDKFLVGQFSLEIRTN